MRRALILHPDCRQPGVASIEVDVARPAPGRLELAFRLAGRTADIAWPAARPPGRADGLWRHTCFEAFVLAGDGPGYVEVNLSPSGQWQAYRFDGYRAGMRVAEAAAAVEARKTADACRLRATLDLSDIAAEAPWRLGLAAVIATAAGGPAYWALAHPPGRPDFHHADGFALALAAAEEDA